MITDCFRYISMVESMSLTVTHSVGAYYIIRSEILHDLQASLKYFIVTGAM